MDDMHLAKWITGNLRGQSSRGKQQNDLCAGHIHLREPAAETEVDETAAATTQATGRWWRSVKSTLWWTETLYSSFNLKEDSFIFVGNVQTGRPRKITASPVVNKFTKITCFQYLVWLILSYNGHVCVFAFYNQIIVCNKDIWIYYQIKMSAVFLQYTCHDTRDMPSNFEINARKHETLTQWQCYFNSVPGSATLSHH